MSRESRTEAGEAPAGRSADEKRIDLTVLIILLLFFFGLFAAFGTPVYNDSDQYIRMHVHREPVYPTFLWALRSVMPEHYLTAASVLQSCLCVISSFAYVRYARRTFGLGLTGALTVCGFVIAPYVITPVFSQLHVHMSVAIMSESIALPVFNLFVIRTHRAAMDRTPGSLAMSFLLALLLSLIRSQMIFTFILWLIVSAYACVTVKKTGWLVLSACVCLAGFLLRDVGTRAYNYAFNGRYVDSVYSHVNLLTNVLYVTDPDDVESIGDEELRTIAGLLYARASDAGYLYFNAEPGLTGRVEYLEEVHDRIKYDCIEYGLRDYVEETLDEHDYIEYNRIGDGYAGELIRLLLPAVFGKWFPDVLLLGLRGLVRNMAVCAFPAYLYVGAVMAFMLARNVPAFKRDPRDPVALFAFVALLAVFGNSFCTAMVIMCLSRYMIYGFAGFYAALYLTVLDFVNYGEAF